MQWTWNCGLQPVNEWLNPQSSLSYYNIINVTFCGHDDLLRPANVQVYLTKNVNFVSSVHQHLPQWLAEVQVLGWARKASAQRPSVSYQVRIHVENLGVIPGYTAVEGQNNHVIFLNETIAMIWTGTHTLLIRNTRTIFHKTCTLNNFLRTDNSCLAKTGYKQ